MRVELLALRWWLLWQDIEVALRFHLVRGRGREVRGRGKGRGRGRGG